LLRSAGSDTKNERVAHSPGFPSGVTGNGDAARLKSTALGSEVSDILKLLPFIRITLDIAYDVDAPDLGPLSDCIIDLNPGCCFARVVLTFGPLSTAAYILFADVPAPGKAMPLT